MSTSKDYAKNERRRILAILKRAFFGKRPMASMRRVP